MTKTKKVKAAGRYSARYGRSVRTKITEVENIQRKKQNCVFCNKTAKRISKGIWYCQNCNKKFASHAYYLPKKEEVNLNNQKNTK